MAIHQNKRFCGGRKADPEPRVAFRGRALPPSEKCAPQAKNMFPQARIVHKKKVTGPVPLECILGPTPPKYCL